MSKSEFSQTQKITSETMPANESSRKPSDKVLERIEKLIQAVCVAQQEYERNGKGVTLSEAEVRILLGPQVPSDFLDNAVQAYIMMQNDERNNRRAAEIAASLFEENSCLNDQELEIQLRQMISAYNLPRDMLEVAKEAYRVRQREENIPSDE
jgi:hypothetical protein